MERSGMRDCRSRISLRSIRATMRSATTGWRLFMQRPCTSRLAVLALLCLGLAISGDAAWAQAARTIRVFISVPPGGTIDLLVRVLADHIGKTRGQTIIVESRPGAAAMIAAEAVARAAPDGNTLLV